MCNLIAEQFLSSLKRFKKGENPAELGKSFTKNVLPSNYHENDYLAILDQSLAVRLGYEQRKGSTLHLLASLGFSDLLNRLITLYWEREKNYDFLLSYVDDEQLTVLHYWANFIVRQDETGAAIGNDEWKTYRSLLAKKPELASEKDKWERTAAEIITSETNLQLYEEKIVIN